MVLVLVLTKHNSPINGLKSLKQKFLTLNRKVINYLYTVISFETIIAMSRTAGLYWQIY